MLLDAPTTLYPSPGLFPISFSNASFSHVMKRCVKLKEKSSRCHPPPKEGVEWTTPLKFNQAQK